MVSGQVASTLLFATCIGTSPVLLVLIAGIVASFLPEQPTGIQPDGSFSLADDAPSLMQLALAFGVSLALASFVVSIVVAFAWHQFRQALKRTEKRLGEDRFGWKPSTGLAVPRL